MGAALSCFLSTVLVPILPSPHLDAIALTSYGETYQAIATDEEQKWLQTVIRFVVYQRIVENKYAAWLREGTGFADETVAQTMAQIYRFRYEMPTVARLIHVTLLRHSDREAEDWEKQLAQQIIAGVFDLLRVDRLGSLPPWRRLSCLKKERGRLHETADL